MLRKFSFSLFYLIAYALIFYGYYKFIVPIYGYSGFKWNPDNIKIIEGVLLTAILPYFLPKDFNKPSDILLHIQLLFPILPMFVLYGAGDDSREYLYYTVTAFLLMRLITSRLHVKAIRVGNLSPIIFQRLLLAISWSVIGSIILFGGLKYLNFDLSKVYDFRADAAANLPPIYGYLSSLTSKVLLPFSLLLAVINKDRFFALASIAGSVMMLGLTAHKGPLFYPFAVLALFFILQKKNVIRMLLYGYLFIVGISLLGFAVGGLADWIGNLMLRRTYLVPAHLNYLYYDFFSTNPFVFWAESKITFGLLESPYNLNIPNLIGREYYDNDLTGANTGWIGAGYSNAGFFGMLVYAAIIGILMSLLDSYSKFIDKGILVAIIVAPMLAVMMSSDLPTAFLNHGVILSLILFAMFAPVNLPHTKIIDKRIILLITIRPVRA